jgi:hypothetical protein
MTVQIAAEEDVELQFARQLYQSCLERHGEDHEQTRLMRQYVASFEKVRLAEARVKHAAAAASLASQSGFYRTEQLFMLPTH